MMENRAVPHLALGRDVGRGAVERRQEELKLEEVDEYDYGRPVSHMQPHGSMPIRRAPAPTGPPRRSNYAPNGKVHAWAPGHYATQKDDIELF